MELTNDTSEESTVEKTLNGESVKMKKKDKRKLRHEKWMTSNNSSLIYLFIIAIRDKCML